MMRIALVFLLFFSLGCGKDKIISEEHYAGKLINKYAPQGMVTNIDTSDLVVTVKTGKDSIFFESTDESINGGFLKRDDQFYDDGQNRHHRTFRLKSDSLIVYYGISNPSWVVIAGDFEGKKN